MSDDFIVTMNDVRQAKLCSGGARKFFAYHNLDWADFLDNGILASTLIKLDDAMAMQVVEVANGRRK